MPCKIKRQYRAKPWIRPSTIRLRTSEPLPLSKARSEVSTYLAGDSNWLAVSRATPAPSTAGHNTLSTDRRSAPKANSKLPPAGEADPKAPTARPRHLQLPMASRSSCRKASREITVLGVIRGSYPVNAVFIGSRFSKLLCERRGRQKRIGSPKNRHPKI